MNKNDLEKRLAALTLARATDDYLDRGLALVHAVDKPAIGFWQRRLPFVLASALVLSVTANIFQLVSHSHQDTAIDAGQMAQCNTPAAAAAAPVDVPDNPVFATQNNSLQPLGMC